MASVNSASGSTYTDAAYSSKGFTSMVSGLDTEGLVKSMLSGIQNKIDKQTQARQQLLWKQEMYRGVITKINDFQNKYFNLTSKTCLRSNAIFNTMKTSSDSKAVTISSATASGNTSIQVAQLASATTVTSGKASGTINLDASQFSFEEGGSASSVNITLSGITKSFELSAENTMEDLQAKVKASFGTSISFEQSGDNWSISAGAGQNLTISDKSGGLAALGLDSAISTRIDCSAALGSQNLATALVPGSDDKYSFRINGQDFEFESTATINEIMQKVNDSSAGVTMSYNELSDSFTLKSSETGKGFEINMEDTSGNALASLFSGSTEKAGQNAVFTVNGVAAERTSNSFIINGMAMTLNDVTGSYISDGSGGFVTNADGSFTAAAGTTEQKALVTSSRDTSKILDTVKSFVEDYNKLIEDLNTKTHEEAKCKKYPPLTDAQKEEMSESEIEKWEEAAKTGLLRGDSDINNLLSSMRNSISSNYGTKYVLSQVGVNTSSEWKDFGKLIIDEDELTKALESDAEGVAEIFTGSSGLASRLNNIASVAAETSSGKPGSLVRLAGVVGKATESSNTINKQLDSIADKIERLKDQYEMQKSRYWSQFNAMEEALSNLSSTSNYLTSMLGG